MDETKELHTQGLGDLLGLLDHQTIQKASRLLALVDEKKLAALLDSITINASGRPELQISVSVVLK